MIAKTALSSCLLVASLIGQPPGRRPPTNATFPDTIPLGLPELPLSATNPLTKPAFELGKRLFFDAILSADRKISCASCHQPNHGFSTPEQRPAGVYGRRALRHAPTLYNRGYGLSQRWDGLATNLEQQVLLPIEDPNEMGLSLADAVARLATSQQYQSSFIEVYGEGVSELTLSRSLASFVRGLILGDSPVDRFSHGDRRALSKQELAGKWIYESKGGCWRCHTQPNFTDEKFHNTGIGVQNGKAQPGRAAVTSQSEDRGRFKTPTLRGLVHTAPYMHDGSLATLEDVVAFYQRGGNPNPERSPLLKRLNLNDDDVTNLLAFLRALSQQGEDPEQQRK